MNQILLPPSSQEPQPSAVAAPQYNVPPPPVYTPEPLKRPNRLWRVVKWPIKQVLKGIYLLASLINRHRIISLIGLAVIAVMVAGGVFTYRALNPEKTAVSGSASGGTVNIPDTPFTVVNSAQVPASNGVLLWLHGTKTYNARELWNAMSTQYQTFYQLQGSSPADLQTALDKFRAEGLKFDQFIISGSFLFPDGTATYTVEVVVHENAQRGIFTWYFKTDPAGQILSFRDLSQG